MTRDEVILAVGAPPGDYTTQQTTYGMSSAGTGVWPTQGVERWACDEALLEVQFRDGRAVVVGIATAWPRPWRPSLTERIRQRIGL